MFVPRGQHRKANAFEVSKNVDFFIRRKIDLRELFAVLQWANRDSLLLHTKSTPI